MAGPSGSAGTLYVNIAARVEELDRALDKAQRKVSNFAKFTNSAFAKLSVAFGAGFTAERFAAGFLSVARSMEATGRAAERLGIGTESLLGLQHGAEVSGSSAESLGVMLTRLNKLIGNAREGSESALKPFKSLGIEFKTIRDTPIDQTLGKIADSLNKIKNPADRTRIVMELFGKSGAQMLDILKGGPAAIAAWQAQLKKDGGLFSAEDAERAEKFNNAWERLQKVAGNAMKDFVIDITPAAIKAVETLQGIMAKTRNASDKPFFQLPTFTPGGRGDRLISFLAGGFDADYGQSAGIGQRRMDGIWGEMFHPQVTANTPRKPLLDFGFLKSHFGTIGGSSGRMASLFGRNAAGLFSRGDEKKKENESGVNIGEGIRSALMSGIVHNLFTGPNTIGRMQSKAWRDAQKEAEAERLRKLQERHPALRRESNAALEFGTREASIAARGGRTDYMREVSKTAKQQLIEAQQTNEILRKGQGVVALGM